LNRFDPSSGTFTRYQHDESDPESLASNNIASIVEAPDGTLWIATGGFSLHGSGLDNFDPQTGKVKHFTHDPQNEHSLSGDDVMSLWLDPDGALWIGTWANGLSHMNLADPGYFTRYQNDPYFPDSLSGDEVWSLFRDRSGILWVGTSHSGINKLPANAGQFSLYRNNPGNPASLGRHVGHLQKINAETSGSPHGGAGLIASILLMEFLRIITMTLRIPTACLMICSWMYMLIHTTWFGLAHWARV
jgi:streptogramin lyase